MKKIIKEIALYKCPNNCAAPSFVKKDPSTSTYILTEKGEIINELPTNPSVSAVSVRCSRCGHEAIASNNIVSTKTKHILAA